MTTTVRSDNVDKLNGANFNRWKWQISMVLEAADLLDVVDGTETAPQDETPLKNTTKDEDPEESKAFFSAKGDINGRHRQNSHHQGNKASYQNRGNQGNHQNRGPHRSNQIRGNQQHPNNQHNQGIQTLKFKGKCFYCDKEGHLKRDCRSLKRDRHQNERAQFADANSDSDDVNAWVGVVLNEDSYTENVYTGNGQRYIRQSVIKDAVRDIPTKEIGEEVRCESCELGKSKRKPFPRVTTPNTYKPGESIYADLAGKMSVASIGGSWYFLLLKDHATGYRSVYFLKRKSEAAAHIKSFIAFIENQTGVTVKQFFTDNGTEFINRNLQTFFRENRIQHNTSVRYCPESNGKIEREIGTIKDCARTMLSAAGLPAEFWAEAVGTTVYIHNRVLDSQSSDITAYEAIMRGKPSLAHIKVFGCDAFAHVPHQLRKTWDPKGTKCIMVGYSGSNRKYRLFNPNTNKTFEERNVTFIESKTETITVDVETCAPIPDEKHEEPSFEDPGSAQLDSNRSDSNLSATPSRRIIHADPNLSNVSENLFSDDEEEHIQPTTATSPSHTSIPLSTHVPESLVIQQPNVSPKTQKETPSSSEVCGHTKWMNVLIDTPRGKFSTTIPEGKVTRVVLPKPSQEKSAQWYQPEVLKAKLRPRQRVNYCESKNGVPMLLARVELGHNQEHPTPIMVDNQSAIRITKNPEMHGRTKHIDHFIRELVTNKQVSILYVPTQEQLADILTKALLKGKLSQNRKNLALTDTDGPTSNNNSNPRRNRVIGPLSPAVIWVNWTTLVNIQNNGRISQSVYGDYSRTRSIFTFQVSLDTQNEGSNFCELKLNCTIMRRQPSSECKDWRKLLLTFGNLSVRGSIYGECSREKSFTKWFHVECPSNLKMTSEHYAYDELKLAGCTDPKFISKEDAAQMQVKTEQGKTAGILCYLVIFGLLTEISEVIFPVSELHEFERQLDDRSSLGTLLFPALTSSYNTNRESGTSCEDEVKLVKEHSLQDVRANKFLFAVESPVFRKMLFETDMLEKSTGVITVPKEIPLEALTTFVKLCQNQCYEKFNHNNIQNLLHVLSLAHMYQADRVKDICMMVIMAVNNRSIEIDIAVKLLSAAGLYNIPDFRVRAFEWMNWRSETHQGKDEVLEFLKTAGEDVHMGFINYLL
ncbi:unnamed protein product [Allacma fusca]|uniref:Polyprotein n=1 Tax=Allacma fusca TaxID=39272 RepID=A0A8J2KRY2_9HEXA|nr:unnamed protein product [Allacma fusca]